MIKHLSIVIVVMTIVISGFSQEIEKAPKLKSFEVGQRYLASSTFDMKNIGTTFKIFLPCDEKAIAGSDLNQPELPKGNGETILFVEDEETILTVGKEMLTQLGYNVFRALSPSEALSLVKGDAAGIDLLITDVVMPEMNGKDLADHICTLVPTCKCLFTSGYTGDIIAHHGILDDNVHFLQKPFSSSDLATAVEKTLNA